MKKNLMQEWEELNKRYTMSETMSSTSDIKTSCFNVYETVDNGHYNYEYIKQPFYYKVTFIRNEHKVFCIPVKIEKKTF